MKNLSNSATSDIVKSHSGNAWFETLDIEIPSSYVQKIKDAYDAGEISDPYGYISIFNFGDSSESWHILLTNASNNVVIKQMGCVTFGSSSNYVNGRNSTFAEQAEVVDNFVCIGGRFYFSIPYTRENIESSSDEYGMVQSSISIGDTSGTIKKLAKVCDGFSRFVITTGMCMSDMTNYTTDIYYILGVGYTFDEAINHATRVFVSSRYFNSSSHSENTSMAYENEITYDFLVGTCSHDNTNFSLTLSSHTPMNYRYPPRIAIKSRCQWNFKSPECGYSGSSYQSCSKTIPDCKARDNLARFGGFPGCGHGGLSSQ